MRRAQHIYVVGSRAEGEFASLGRSWADPRRVLAWTSIEAAVFAEASGDVCVPGYFSGGDNPGPMSSLEVEEIMTALTDAGFDEHVTLHVWEGALDVWPEKTRLWVERLTTAQMEVLRRVFDRHADPSIVGRGAIYCIEVRD